MRFLFFFLSLAATIALVVILNTTKLLPAPLGKLLSPQEGVWQNAEKIGGDLNADIRIPGLKGKTEVYLDERMVPHIFSDNEEDVYFVQGYIHAKFRLWQMEFQTLAASGRISEIIGDKAVNYDRRQRRLGITYAAERTLKLVQGDIEQ